MSNSNAQSADISRKKDKSKTGGHAPPRIADRTTHASISWSTNQFQEVIIMLRWALIFLVVALVAALFGFTGIAAAAAGIAKFLFFLFLVMCLVFLIIGISVGRKVSQ